MYSSPWRFADCTKLCFYICCNIILLRTEISKPEICFRLSLFSILLIFFISSPDSKGKLRDLTAPCLAGDRLSLTPVHSAHSLLFPDSFIKDSQIEKLVMKHCLLFILDVSEHFQHFCILYSEREILLHFRLRARWQPGGSRIYLNLESSILLNPSCYYTFGVATL